MAIINIGSGSVKLYLEKTQRTEARVTLLASYADTGEMAALDDTFNAVVFFHQKAKDFGEDVCIFGTESMRQIGPALSDMIFSRLGLSVDIISGEKEALCGFLGCTGDGDDEATEINIDKADTKNLNTFKSGNSVIYNDDYSVCKNVMPSNNIKTAVIDVGGASTEISVGINKPDFYVSLPIGSVKLFNRFKVINKKQNEVFLQSLYQYIDDTLMPIDCEDFSKISKIKLLGGGASNLAAILLNKTAFDLNSLDKSEIPFQKLPLLIPKLFGMTVKGRTKKYPFLEEKRALVLPYGVSIIYRLLHLLPNAKAMVSRKGLIEGYLKLKALQK